MFDYLTGKLFFVIKAVAWPSALAGLQENFFKAYSLAFIFKLVIFQHFYEKSSLTRPKTGRTQWFSPLCSAQCSWEILLIRDLAPELVDTLISRIIPRRKQHFCTIFLSMSRMIEEELLLILVIGDKFLKMWRKIDLWSSKSLPPFKSSLSLQCPCMALW